MLVNRRSIHRAWATVLGVFNTIVVGVISEQHQRFWKGLSLGFSMCFPKTYANACLGRGQPIEVVWTRV